MSKDPNPIETATSWLSLVAAELKLSPEDANALTNELLDLTREVAHNRSRPGAPLTAFLVGLASGGIDEARENIKKIRDII